MEFDWSSRTISTLELSVVGDKSSVIHQHPQITLECTSADWQVPRLGQSVSTRRESVITCVATGLACLSQELGATRLGRHELMT